MTDPIWLAEAKRYTGLKEIEGTKNEPGIVQFFADSGNSWVKDDETAWCGAFVSAMFARIGRPDIRPPGEKANALRALQWLNVGTPVDKPQVGDLAIFSRSGGGHVAFYMGEDADSITVLGGNQSNKVSIAKYARSRLKGYRRPPVAPQAPSRQPDDPGPSKPTKPRQTLWERMVAFFTSKRN